MVSRLRGMRVLRDRNAQTFYFAGGILEFSQSDTRNTRSVTQPASGAQSSAASSAQASIAAAARPCSLLPVPAPATVSATGGCDLVAAMLSQLIEKRR